MVRRIFFWEQREARRERRRAKQRAIIEEVRREGRDILESRNYRRTREHIQHGDMTVQRHTMDVARYSVFISQKLRISCDRQALIRGALLHDYFLYDWHDKEHVNIARLHGFRHPGIALKNAEQEYDLTDREKEIIEKHMWPLTVVPPMCREAWIVTAADKYCSLMETLHLHKRYKRNKE
ncbi:MAG: HD domain-containing protein [Lachnospiraceae bacterium]|nr:HD domain-containing protein [Lachnospiraceae bacterium]